MWFVGINPHLNNLFYFQNTQRNVDEFPPSFGYKKYDCGKVNGELRFLGNILPKYERTNFNSFINWDIGIHVHLNNLRVKYRI